MLRTVGKKMLKLLGYEVTRAPSRVERSRPSEAPIDARVHRLIKAMWPVRTDIPLIRQGGEVDGAYLLPDDLDGITALFSPGVEAVAGFETDMAARGLTCYMADASVSSPPVDNPAFCFQAKFLGLRETEQTTTIDAWVGKYEPGEHDLILQMDIEGGEWPVLANVSDQLLRRFRIIIIEVHSLNRLLDEYGRQTILEVLERLLETHHVVHHHPNNWGKLHRHAELDIPDVTEITFHRKDRAVVRGYATQFPHPLDIVNCAELPTQPLPAAWRSVSA